jgi:photosystem II stability/assembly factor-like uncharacterized protein
MTSRPATRILVGTADGLHTLGGRSSPQLSGHEIRGLSDDEQGWWAIVDRRHLYRRARGSRWKRIADVQSVDGGQVLEAFCLLPTNESLLVGTSEAQLMQCIGTTVELSGAFVAQPDRKHWYTPWGGAPETRSMALAADGTIYVNVHVGGVLHSRDGGNTWKQMLDIDRDAHQIAVHPDHPNHLYVASAEGLGVSRDAGAHWTFETDGLHANYQRAVAISRDRVLVSTSHGPQGRQGAIYWRPVKGRRPFVKCEVGLPQWFDDNINTFALTATDTLAAFGTADGRVFVSEDQGDSWQQIGDGLPAVHCLRIVQK